MELCQFNPYVRHVGRVLRPMAYPEFLYAHDYRLLYVNQGGFTVQFEKECCQLSEGSMFIFPPAIPYRLLFSADVPVDFYILNFDFVSTHWNTPAHAPNPAESFCREEVYSEEALNAFKSPFLLKNARSLAPFLQEIEAESRSRSEMSDCAVSGLMKVIIARAMAKENEEVSVHENPLIEKVAAYIQAHIRQPLTNNSIAEYFGYHPYYLNTLFQKYRGVTMHNYLAEQRFKLAKELLVRSDASISAIALDCGFGGAAYFTEFFTKNAGMSPTTYRKNFL